MPFFTISPSLVTRSNTTMAPVRSALNWRKASHTWRTAAVVSARSCSLSFCGKIRRFTLPRPTRSNTPRISGWNSSTSRITALSKPCRRI
ncbi:MAG: hypothetical protein FWF60_06170 [Oscillospiraceae bacterium]|nr:hypothetical protein [Oscillospiraceae bacterium]